MEQLLAQNSVPFTFESTAGVYLTVPLSVDKAIKYLAVIEFDLAVGEHNTTVVLNLFANRKPYAGSGGTAISCDGIDDYLYNDDFEWPIGEFDTPVFLLTEYFELAYSYWFNILYWNTFTG
jgi:hypothetical protein